MLKKTLEKTALLRNLDGSIYHLNLLPGELAETIILVGDPDRVAHVSQHFDRIEIQKQKREFVTHTGTLNGQRLSVISTGIGTDNIDIVVNECDALHNVDFEKNCVKAPLTSLRFLRMGTCGGIGKNNSVDRLVLTRFAVGFDGLMSFYCYQYSENERMLLNAIQQHFYRFPAFQNAYVAETNNAWAECFKTHCQEGITLTCSGFYGPQYRTLRAPLIAENILEMASHFSNDMGRIINVEMETAGIYALSNLLGHAACSISVIIDNTTTDEISKNIPKAIDTMIASMLACI